MKTCRVCHEEKPESAFGASNRNKDGMRTECNECRKVERGGLDTTFRQQICAILNEAGGSIHIAELREKFGPTNSARVAVSSALNAMTDCGQIRITGGGHSNSVKMIELVQEPLFPMADKARRISLTDAVFWNDAPIRVKTSLQSGFNHFMNICG